MTNTLLYLANKMIFEMGGADARTKEIDVEAISYNDHFDELKSEL